MLKFFPRPAVISIFMFLFAATLYAQSSNDEPRNEVEVRGIYSIPSGETSFSTTTNQGSTISFDRDFDFDNEFGYTVRYTYKSPSGKHKFLAEYDSTEWDRTTRLSRSFTFLGETYVANLDTTGELNLRTFRGMYSYRWGNEKFRMGPMVDAGVIDTRIKITGTTNNGQRTTEGTITKFAATVGYDLDYKPNPKIQLFNSLGGIVFSGDRLFHVEAGVKYFPVRNFGLSGGYRYRWYKFVEDDNFIKFTINGPFFGGIVRF